MENIFFKVRRRKREKSLHLQNGINIQLTVLSALIICETKQINWKIEYQSDQRCLKNMEWLRMPSGFFIFLWANVPDMYRALMHFSNINDVFFVGNFFLIYLDIYVRWKQIENTNALLYQICISFILNSYWFLGILQIE